MNLEKHIYEGWTVGAFIESLEPTINTIMQNHSFVKPFANKQELKVWCMDNQPYYKKHIPDVVNYFAKKFKIK